MAAKSLTYQFLDVRVELARFRVLRAGKPLALEPKAIETLLFLLERPGRLIEKDELLNGVWKDAFVTPNVLTRIIAQLRRELGDDPKTAHIIQTVPTRGYVFLPAVERCEEESSDETALAAVTEATRRITQTLNGKLKLRAAPLELPDEFEQMAALEHDAADFAVFETASLPHIEPPVTALAESVAAALPAPSSRNLARPAFFSLLALCVLAAGWWSYRTASIASRALVIAVLPFKPLVADSRDVSFEMGMAETLISKLGTLRQMQVRPLSAVRRYAQLEQDLLAAGRELQAEAVLEGSIQKIIQAG